jgi:hypothetical protein
MTDYQTQRAQTILQSMRESARPAFDDEHIEHLEFLVGVVVRFYDYLVSPVTLDDHDRNYLIDSLFINLDSFRAIMQLYGVLVGSRKSTIDWDAISIPSLKEEFVCLYHVFIAETNFENKCRLLLDLTKLLIVHGGASYDCPP